MLPGWKPMLIILFLLLLWERTTCVLWKKTLEFGIKIDMYMITFLFEEELRKNLLLKKKKEDEDFKRVHFRIFAIFQIQDNQIYFAQL